VRILSYFSKPRGVREQKSLRNSALKEMFTTKRGSPLKREKSKLNIEKIFFFAFHKILLCLPNQGISDVGACTDA